MGLSDIIENLEDLEPKKKIEKKKEKPRPKKDEGISPTDERPPDITISSPVTPKSKSSDKKKGDDKKKKDQSKLPVKFKGDGQTTYSREAGVITLQENVVITQGDLRLQSDKARVKFLKNANSKEEVDEVLITGQVKVSKFDPNPMDRIVAHGDKAVFYNSEQKIRLIGNARLYRGGDLMKGKQIIYEIETGIVLVDQAKGIVQPEEAQK